MFRHGTEQRQRLHPRTQPILIIQPTATLRPPPQQRRLPFRPCPDKSSNNNQKPISLIRFPLTEVLGQTRSPLASHHHHHHLNPLLGCSPIKPHLPTSTIISWQTPIHGSMRTCQHRPCHSPNRLIALLQQQLLEALLLLRP